MRYFLFLALFIPLLLSGQKTVEFDRFHKCQWTLNDDLENVDIKTLSLGTSIGVNFLHNPNFIPVVNPTDSFRIAKGDNKQFNVGLAATATIALFPRFFGGSVYKIKEGGEEDDDDGQKKLVPNGPCLSFEIDGTNLGQLLANDFDENAFKFGGGVGLGWRLSKDFAIYGVVGLRNVRYAREILTENIGNYFSIDGESVTDLTADKYEPIFFDTEYRMYWAVRFSYVFRGPETRDPF